MKVGDLVKISNGLPERERVTRQQGIIVSFDKDDDPCVLWFDPSFFGQPEANFRRHIVVLSGC